MANSLLVECRHVGKRFGERTVLGHIDLRIERKEIITLIGLNGSGKTTLLKIIMGILPPDSGEVVRAPGLRIGYVPQKNHFDPTLPLTVEYWLRLATEDNSGWKEKISFVCKEVGLPDILNQRLQSLSGGELQRVMLARALLREPDLLVLDEPVQAVDITGQAALYDLIATVSKRRGCAVLLVSHDLHLVMSATQKVICLNQHICCQGTPHKVSKDPAFIALFGQPVSDSLAVYTHHHDHEHGEHGEIIHTHG